MGRKISRSNLESFVMSRLPSKEHDQENVIKFLEALSWLPSHLRSNPSMAESYMRELQDEVAAALKYVQAAEGGKHADAPTKGIFNSKLKVIPSASPQDEGGSSMTEIDDGGIVTIIRNVHDTCIITERKIGEMIFGSRFNINQLALLVPASCGKSLSSSLFSTYNASNL